MYEIYDYFAGDRAHDERGFFFLLFDESYFYGEFMKSREIANGIGIWKSEKHEVPIYDVNENIVGYKVDFKYLSKQKSEESHVVWTMKLYRLNNPWLINVYGKVCK